MYICESHCWRNDLILNNWGILILYYNFHCVNLFGKEIIKFSITNPSKIIPILIQDLFNHVAVVDVALKINSNLLGHWYDDGGKLSLKKTFPFLFTFISLIDFPDTFRNLHKQVNFTKLLNENGKRGTKINSKILKLRWCFVFCATP